MNFFVDPDIRKAATLHSDFYTSDEIFEQSKHQLFKSSWQYVYDTDSFNSNDRIVPKFILPHFLDEPVVLVKQNKDDILCLSNVCTHRGNILVNEPCAHNHIRCKYHGRTFQLNGKFLQMPEFNEVQNFPSQKDDLTNYPIKQWGKFIFTSIAPSFSFDDLIHEMKQRISFLDLYTLKLAPARSKDYYINAHWALYCENYLEGFHIPFVHAELNKAIDYGQYETHLFNYSNLQIGIAKDEEHIFELPSHSPEYGKRVAAYYFWVFPNMMFNFYPWGLSINIVQPISKERTKVSFITFISDETKLDLGAGASLDKVEMEDEEIVESVQKGIRSSAYSQGRYSPTRETGTHHFHQLICKFFNHNN
jgi:choline monooxygenase